MERFYGNEDGNHEDPFFGSNEDDEFIEGEFVGYIDQQGILDVMHMDLVQSELNQSLLSKAIEVAKGSWFWVFKSPVTRLNEIEMIYQRLLKMTEVHDSFNPMDQLDPKTKEEEM